MREIKFRTYWKEYNEMKYPGKGECICDFAPRNCPVDKTIIWMQFTGLKDKNGKEIYEGDIIKKPNFITNNKKLFVPPVWVIEYDNGGYHAVCQDQGEGHFHLSLVTRTFEVIGNIYEDSELLEEKQ